MKSLVPLDRKSFAELACQHDRHPEFLEAQPHSRAQWGVGVSAGSLHTVPRALSVTLGGPCVTPRWLEADVGHEIHCSVVDYAMSTPLTSLSRQRISSLLAGVR